MMTLKKFTEKMNGTMLEFTGEQLESIYEWIDYDEFGTVEEVENEYDENDFSILFDASLSSLFDDMEYNGFKEEQLMTLLGAMCGHCIDLYYCKDDDMYAMCIGAR